MQGELFDQFKTSGRYNLLSRQGSVLGPTLYLLCTADVPTTAQTTIATFADDAAIMAAAVAQADATSSFQQKLYKNWSSQCHGFKIKLNAQKSILIAYTLKFN